MRKLKYISVTVRLYSRKVIAFLKKRVEVKTFIILSSLIVGIISGLAAVLLKQVVYFFQQLPKNFSERFDIDYLYSITPLLGIILTVVFIQVLFPGKIKKGLSHIIYLISRKSSDIPPHNIFSHIITSGITVGLGGSAGLEAPIVFTGAAIGSNISKELRFNYTTRTLLLACGSAAGISAIFGSPIAGVIFAFEVLLPEFSIPSLIPLLIASASSAVLSKLLYSGQLFYLVTVGWEIKAVPFYIVLGILCGVISLYIIKISLSIEEAAEKIARPYLKAAIGGLALCILIFLFPSLYGEGYETIEKLLAGNYNNLITVFMTDYFPDKNFALIIFAAIIVFLKIIATSLTLSSGGNGGIIAPSLFTGAITGFFLAHTAGYFNVSLNHPNFIVVGMAGILAGVLHSPLTAIFLIAEVTGGYLLMVPLMIVTALSFFISRYFHPHSIYTAQLYKSGIKFRTEKEKYFVQQLSLDSLIETNFLIIKPRMTLREMVEKISQSKRNLFPVVDDSGRLIGIVSLDDIREFILNTELYDVVLVYEIMNTHFYSVDINTDINKVLEIFEQNTVWNIPITKNGLYLGFISKSILFDKYLNIWARRQKEDI